MEQQHAVARASQSVSRAGTAVIASALPTRDLTRRRGQGNGVRLHSLLFAAISVGVLAGFMVLIAIAGTRM